MYKTVAECYEGQSVFITGGTGFLGQTVIEKLLYSCPGLEKIYVLVREKKNTTPQQRIQKILEGPVFSRLRNERPLVLGKIVPIVGDISKPKLGIKVEDEELLTNKVSLVFHAAATLKFNETLEVAMNINVGGTERMLDLSRRMRNIKAFIYVSTAYTNLNRDVIDEILYPAPASLDEVKKLVKIGITEKQTKELLQDRPNTYIFTKALAEHVVAKNHENIPSIIIRPSIVSCVKEEPVVGWLQNWMGPSAVMLEIIKGWNHILFCRSSNIVDLIPVDYVSNLIIVAATKTECSKDVAVYNCCTSAENPMKMGNFLQSVVDYSYKYKAYEIPFPFICFTTFKWILFLLTLILQIIPAIIGDIYLLLRGKDTRYTKIQVKVFVVRNICKYFMINSWIIRASKARALIDSLSPSDKKIYYYDVTDIKWNDYISIYCQGIQRFLCKK